MKQDELPESTRNKSCCPWTVTSNCMDLGVDTEEFKAAAESIIK